MKKLLVVLSMALITFAGFAVMPEGKSVITKDGKVECKRMSFNMLRARIVLNDGKILKMPVALIRSYHEDGKQFDKVELYRMETDVRSNVFMELLKQRNDYSLYRYQSINYDASSAYETTDIFYVYHQGKYFMELTDKSLPDVFRFFNVKYVYN